MTSRCLFMTSSYSSTCLRAAKFIASTWRCAHSIALLTSPAWMGMSSGICVRSMSRADAVHPVAAEQAHEVVLEREVELRQARVALASGTAAELVVDAARLVALGAEDGEAAGLDDLHVLLGRDLLGALRARRGLCSSVASSGLMPRSMRMSSTSESGLPPSTMSVPRPAMLVAMVTAPRRPACAMMCASISWNFALSTLCLMPRFSSMPRERSEFSIEIVPTRQGWPVSWRSTISSTTASNFALTCGR